MTLAPINPQRSTMKARRHETSTRGDRSNSTTGRVVAAVAFLTLPLVGATAATASPAPPGTSNGHATQQQVYLDGLERAAMEGDAAGPTARAAAFAAQQRSHFGYLDQAGATARAALAAQQRTYVQHLERARPSARAALAAQQRTYVEQLAQAASRSDALDVDSASVNAASDTGDGVPVAMAALLALGGIAVGSGATVATRRLPVVYYRRGTV